MGKKVKPKAERTPRTRKPRQPVTKLNQPPKAAAKVSRRAIAPKPTKLREGQAIGKAASRLIDQRIRDLGGWRGKTLALMRALILEADPDVIEEWKWMGTPVWSRHGIICTGEAYKKVVKLTFARGASIPDPSRLFNSSLEGNTRRAIDIHEGETVDARAFRELVKAAVIRNGAPDAVAKSKTSPKGAKSNNRRKREKAGVLLAGGNPQIAKADGDAPVQAYIAALSGWKRDVAKRLDALIARNVPNVLKAVKWNSPFYGIEGNGWFLSFHVFTHYLKVTFFGGASLQPVPPGGTVRSKDARWIDIRENDRLDEAQITTWVKQAAARPGWLPGRQS